MAIDNKNLPEYLNCLSGKNQAIIQQIEFVKLLYNVNALVHQIILINPSVSFEIGQNEHNKKCIAWFKAHLHIKDLCMSVM